MSLKSKAREILKPLSINVNPNMVSGLAIVSMLTACWFIYQQQIIYSIIFILLSGLLDVLDGSIAFYNKRTTKFGDFFDKFSDKLNDSLIIIAIVLFRNVNIALGLFALFFVTFPSYMISLIEAAAKRPIVVKFAPSRLIKTAILIAGLLTDINIAFLVLVIYGIYSTAIRVILALKELKK